MLINRDSKPWALTAVAIFIASVVAYVPYHLSQPAGPSGGTWMGILYGVIGTAFILLAIALTPRKKFRTMRVGRVYWWMQAHIWFGLLAFPIIVLHAGFRDGLWGGWMTRGLMGLFILIEISGIVGLILQNVLPGKLLRDVQYETIFEQIDAVLGKLRDEAAGLVRRLTERKTEAPFELEVIPAGGAVSTAGTAKAGLSAMSAGGAGSTLTAGSAGTATATLDRQASTSADALPSETASVTPGSIEVRQFYEQHVAPVLAAATRPPAHLATPELFDRLRARTPLLIHEVIADLQSIVDERRQLDRQRRLHTFLHAWLWVHIPLSFALLILTVVHIVVALQYRNPW